MTTSESQESAGRSAEFPLLSSNAFFGETQGSVSLDSRGAMILCNVEKYMLIDRIAPNHIYQSQPEEAM